ncbi:MAG: formylmethanofuran--tetrahydromethanopterin N-formyltransferase [Candidatus Lokiarchaeota archaeon]|nr:formylmethanofuran--tetrahydromethanopterin N-formyltransferase [Candidatus Lokiarchaeota archaeon]
MAEVLYEEYAEAFEGTVSQLIITANRKFLLEKAVYSFIALPSTVFGDAEGGLVKWISAKETPDGRDGAIVQLWTTGIGKKSQELLYDRLGRRIRQGILVVPTTAVFDGMNSDMKFNMMDNVGHCGDGYEEIIEKYSKKLISVPIMMGHDFLIEENISYKDGVMGGNIWLFCENIKTGIDAGDICVRELLKMDDVITSFDICSAGSKIGGKYPEIGPPTNVPYCPTLKYKIESSKVPDGVESIPEIVINGLTMEDVKKAMKRCIEVAQLFPGVQKISAGNFGGNLGKYKIYLKDL